ncbi:Acetyltransferase (GNAT) family protein [Sinosporangium album]|uniref:Acetyltransferase (GNAT) family protein n=1 Tax=Sinosporangium album TaxID=504805 RepID=A0A1G7YRC1_9ACTN|nr:GNAT family N-acetyltransferase [Sinosporangium album]SDG99103.1 Acetyltransferase (GNAT) family protein [Sinosporangium album]
MRITALNQDLADEVLKLMNLGSPYVRARTPSDYWLYARLFASTCPVALVDGLVVGALIGMRSQEDPFEIYIQDVMTHPDHRRRGVAGALVDIVRRRGREWGCRRIYLTSEPDNARAYAAWTSMGFANTPGDYTTNGVSITRDFKGLGKDRAVFELLLP